jgi:hypothetical protein
VEAWITRVTDAVHDKVDRARKEVREQGLRFLGAAAVMAKSFLHKAKSYEAKRDINPVLARRARRNGSASCGCFRVAVFR